MIQFDDDKEYDIVGIGRNSWDKILGVDHYPKPDEKIDVLRSSSQCGGQVANSLVAASKLGASVKYLGKFGDDANGQAVRNAMFKALVDISACRIIPGVANQSAFIVVDQKNYTRNVFTQKHPKLDIHPGDFAPKDYTSGKVLYLGGRNIEEVKSFAKIGKSKNCVVAVDLDESQPNSEEFLSNVSILFCPKNYLELHIQDESLQSKMKIIFERHALDLICCTLSAQGAVAYDGKQFFQKDAFKINVMDTTGAGDVFQAGFLVSLINGKSIDECLTFANAAAALKCQHLGSQAGIPTSFDIEQFLAPKDVESLASS